MGYSELLAVTGRINDFLNAANILNWDSRTMMPRAGGETRGKQVATLSVAARDLLCSDETLRALEGAEVETNNLQKDDVKRVMTQQVREAVAYHQSIPTSVLRRKEELAGIAHGVLQDVHWSHGQVGFCNYTIGNVMAAQLFETARTETPAIQQGLDKADYAPLRPRLTDKVCQHGRRYSRDELLVMATGRALDPEPYIHYLTGKYTEVYGL